MTRELIFEVVEEEDGGFTAHALGQSIFTQGENLEELKEMVRDATACHCGFEIPFVLDLAH